MKTKKVLQKQSTILLSSLAVTDLLMGAVVLPLSTAIDVLTLQRQVLFANVCTIQSLYACFGFFLGLCSLYHLTVIAWERNVAIRKWMDYKVIVKISRVKKLAIAGWLATFFLAAPIPVLQSAGVDHKVTEGWYIGVNVPATVFLILIVYFYVMVYLGVRKQRKINEMNQVNALIKAKLQSKIATTTFMLTAVVIASHVPLGVVLVLGETFPVLRTIIAIRLAETFLQLNSIFNPVLYCFRNRRFRTAVLELLRMKKPQAIQAAVGAKRSVRKKSSRGSVEDVLERRKADKHRRLFRSESCDQALAVDYHRNNEITLTRTLSAPTLHMYNDTLESQLLESRQQDTTLFTKATTVHVEHGGQYEARQSNGDLPKDGQTGFQGRSNLARIVSRSKSWDAGESVEFADRCCPRLQHSTIRRSESEPWI